MNLKDKLTERVDNIPPGNAVGSTSSNQMETQT